MKVWLSHPGGLVFFGRIYMNSLCYATFRHANGQKQTGRQKETQPHMQILGNPRKLVFGNDI